MFKDLLEVYKFEATRVVGDDRNAHNDHNADDNDDDKANAKVVIRDTDMGMGTRRGRGRTIHDDMTKTHDGDSDHRLFSLTHKDDTTMKQVTVMTIKALKAMHFDF